MHPEQKNRQQALVSLLTKQIQDHGGDISFADFMQTVLYTPRLGYYTSSHPKFGLGGDFVTAPEISFVFSWCVAKYCEVCFEQLGERRILEFGAGSGVMAADILTSLMQNDALPEEYIIIELSADLAEQQRETIRTRCPEALTRVSWQASLPVTFNGVVLANEVLDAMPVHTFTIQGERAFERRVATCNDQFVWSSNDLPSELQKRVEALMQSHLHGVDGYESELSLLIPKWLASVDSMLGQGFVLLIDYGFAGSEYYHPSRSGGTLMCHAKQQSHPDPFANIGMQDITAHVDFSLIASTAKTLLWHLDFYTTQAFFLLAHGLTEFAERASDYNTLQAIKRLTMPHEMGELFKAMSLSKLGDKPLQTNLLRDLRYQL